MDSPRVLVTDFDGTLTQRDFYQVFRDHYLAGDATDFWSEYRAGRMTHFDALRNIFLAAAPGEAALWEMTAEMQLEPDLPFWTTRLKDAGWQVVVVSAGCRWYIDRLLTQAGVKLDVYANNGSVEGGCLQMERPTGSPFFSFENGVNKPAVVQFYLDQGWQVAFAGDGFPDFEAALLTKPDARFARGDLARALEGRGESFHRFERWRDVAAALLMPGAIISEA